MALKVFDLQCQHGHVFEGWFQSQDNYQQQLDSGQLTCPVCGSDQLTKRLSAPRLNLKHGVGEGSSSHTKAENERASTPTQTQQSSTGTNEAFMPTSESLVKMQAELLQKMRTLVAAADNVGEQFAHEARRMHEGEIAERAIRGSASREEIEELLEDGINIMPVPDFMTDERLQ